MIRCILSVTEWDDLCPTRAWGMCTARLCAARVWGLFTCDWLNWQRYEICGLGVVFTSWVFVCTSFGGDNNLIATACSDSASTYCQIRIQSRPSRFVFRRTKPCSTKTNPFSNQTRPCSTKTKMCARTAFSYSKFNQFPNPGTNKTKPFCFPKDKAVFDHSALNQFPKKRSTKTKPFCFSKDEAMFKTKMIPYSIKTKMCAGTAFFDSPFNQI